MKYTILFFLIALVISCSRDTSPLPLSPEMSLRPVCGNAKFDGIYLEFADTCSTDFILSFMDNCDSVKISDSYFGIDLFLYADSGNAAFWTETFKEDTLSFRLRSKSVSDSLILIFRFYPEDKFMNEKNRLINHNHLHYLKSSQQLNAVFVKVPENLNEFWTSYFKQIDFIKLVEPVWMICCY